MNHFLNLILFALFACTACSPKLAKFSLDNNQVKLPQHAHFNNQSPVADRYEWEFGDGTKSVEKNPNHLYTKSGLYTVTLKSFKGNKMNSFQQKIEVLPPEGCYIVIETSLGSMLAKLYDQTPLHRDNFFKHAEQGFYDDLLFHRVISGFMIQGGDPNSRDAASTTMLGSGGPSYTIPAEFNPMYVHKKGAIAAARTGDQVNPKKESSGSQFYIVQGNIQNEQTLMQMEDRKGIKYSQEQRDAYLKLGGTPFLDMEYTVFGEVIEGLDVIDKIAAVRTERGDRPSENIKMKIRALH
jgi:peptidyl-prolyl cis-trans isomerase B (cyclophilin B)